MRNIFKRLYIQVEVDELKTAIMVIRQGHLHLELTVSDG